MKAIAFSRLTGEPISDATGMSLIADSAIEIQRRPVFVPDFADEWVGHIYLACRVSRLGKSITEKFARRYFDSVTLVLRMLPAQWASLPVPPAGAGFMDCAITLGTWTAPDFTRPAEITFSNRKFIITPGDTAFEQAISLISRTATLKTGDIIMPCRIPVSPALTPGTRISASLNADMLLDVKLK